MKKTLRLALSAMLLLCLTLPFAACGGSSAPQEAEPAAQETSFTAADLVGTVWHAPGDGREEDFGFWLEFPSEDRCYIMWAFAGGIDGVAGFDYTVSGRSLSQDGRQAGIISEDFAHIGLTFPDGSSHVFVPDERPLTSQEDFESMLTTMDPLFNEDGSRFRTFEADEGEAAPAAEQEDQVASAAGITVTMPGSWVAKGLAWTVDERFQHMVLEYALNGDRVQIAEIDWDERATLPYEADDEVWELGAVADDGIVHQAALHIMYVDADGKTYSANTSVPDATLASEYFLGLSAEEILSWIQLEEVSVGVTDDASGLSTRRSEFCGVWAYASKDLGEAVWFAGDDRDRGFAAEVFLTTDWSNLNTEPWYVVSLGCCSSEGEAEGVLSSAHSSVYGDAYIKWSGDYIG